MTGPVVERLGWRDPEIATLAFPGRVMTLRQGFGSGLAVRPGDPPGHVWAIGDRGPNIKVGDMMRHYGLDQLAPLRQIPGAKIMPWLQVGPVLAELRVAGDCVELLRIVPLHGADGRPITGLPNPGSDQLLSEPVFDIHGAPITPDAAGLDTEGLVALANGGFWVGDEFGPSLVRVDETGTVIQRILPADAGEIAASGSLPAIAAKRQLNRGFEALAISEDEETLFLAFQSPLAHPDEAAHQRARHVRIWRWNMATATVAAQYAYPLDPPETFRRDMAAGPFGRSDIKVSELLWLADDNLLVLERGSATTKIYRCMLGGASLDDTHLDIATRPTLEELSASPGNEIVPVLGKELVFSTDDHPEMSADLEGMALLSPTQLLLVNDNDFGVEGVEGVETMFWRVTLPTALA